MIVSPQTPQVSLAIRHSCPACPWGLLLGIMGRAIHKQFWTNPPPPPLEATSLRSCAQPTSTMLVDSEIWNKVHRGNDCSTAAETAAAAVRHIFARFQLRWMLVPIKAVQFVSDTFQQFVARNRTRHSKDVIFCSSTSVEFPYRPKMAPWHR